MVCRTVCDSVVCHCVFLSLEKCNVAENMSVSILGIESEEIQALLRRTGYSLKQENGQRRYGGPPPGWNSPPPGRGCEVFIGKVPRDCFENELVPIFERFGRIYEVDHIMLVLSGVLCWALKLN